jgi:uncharacterized protein YfdQ (DUF2303 family)
MTTEDESGTEAASIANLVRQHIKPELVALGEDANGENREVLILPDGLGMQSVKELLDEYRTAPERRKGTAQLGDLASFIAHTSRFSDEHSALFASPNPKAPSLTAVLDYHEKTSIGEPRYGQHRGVYAFPLSDEWVAWTTQNGKPMDQRRFAEFLEDRIIDILSVASGPSGGLAQALADSIQVTFAPAGRLLDLSRGLSIKVNARVTSAQNLATGEVQVGYATTHEDGDVPGLKVPGAFLIGIPVFRNGEGFQIPVRLRYRLHDGAIAWYYEMHGADRVFDAAFRDACDKAGNQTGLPVFFGTPEA